MCFEITSCIDKLRLFPPGKPDIKPMVITVWCCEGKPTNLNEYLGPFVNELNEILRDGISINEHIINVLCRCFICDSPARA